jgi:tetrahydromethanopterin S-methyltransferase subunit G
MMMPSRVIDPHEQTLEQLRGLAATVDRGFDRVDRRLDRMDDRFNGMDKRFPAMDERFNAMDRRFDAMDRKVDDLGAELNRKIDDLTAAVAEIYFIIKPRTDSSGRADEARDDLRRKGHKGEAAAGVG